MSKIIDRAKMHRAAVRDELRTRYPKRLRLEHAHVIGTTGAGKTKFLEHCIQQDIASGRGVCVVDPHGNHPDSLLQRLDVGRIDTLIDRRRTKK